MFDCGDGQPFPMEFLCNGIEDCADGMDEANCGKYAHDTLTQRTHALAEA